MRVRFCMVLAVCAAVSGFSDHERKGRAASGHFIRESEKIVKEKRSQKVAHHSSGICIALTINRLSHKHGTANSLPPVLTQ
ncbi:MAG: hypothetical protein KFF68_08295, partial [Desulfosarcina sp.]|nr:hypothetical protein [Desulfosarcina sp.]